MVSFTLYENGSTMLGLNGQGGEPFTDVSTTAWYHHSVLATYKAGLVHGLSASRFGPDLPLTREQMAVLLANVLIYKGIDVRVTDPATVPAKFEDAGTIDQWAVGAAAVSVQKGLVKGLLTPDEGVVFGPLGNTSRARATVMLRRLLATSEVL